MSNYYYGKVYVVRKKHKKHVEKKDKNFINYHKHKNECKNIYIAYKNIDNTLKMIQY
jgi:hypothetical protein